MTAHVKLKAHLKTTSGLVALLVAPLLSVAQAYAAERVTEPETKPAQRIISLAPHITELLFAIGAGEQVIALDDASDYPEAAKALPKVANYRSLNTERILALSPDLIVAWGSAQSQVVQPLVQLGIKVFFSAPATFDDLSTELNQLGELTGHQAQAAAVVSDYEQELAKLRLEYQDRTPLTVFYQIAEVPLMSANGSTWMSQAVTLCGGVNIMADSLAPYPQVNAEQVLAQNPDVIVAADNAELSHWQQWPALQAVANQQLLTVDANLLHRFTPRSTQGIHQLCEQLDEVRQARAS
ncbi:cobalamin-binding protein [Oceanisphaera sp. IT1-181]|uniref:cobalamin-binding protein n=1 Tax=Oceanisphaera sp. IT1-181 TaxID=3081199 RepID=UPI0029CA1D84|nr:cobalamin-binding protein [Oceanisphaera sp. IT1-181]